MGKIRAAISEHACYWRAMAKDAASGSLARARILQIVGTGFILALVAGLGLWNMTLDALPETLGGKVGFTFILAAASLAVAWLIVFFARLVGAPVRLHRASLKKIEELAPRTPLGNGKFSGSLFEELRAADLAAAKACGGGTKYREHIDGAHRVSLYDLMRRTGEECDRLGLMASRAAIKRTVDDMADDSERVKPYFRLHILVEIIEDECKRNGVAIETAPATPNAEDAQPQPDIQLTEVIRRITGKDSLPASTEPASMEILSLCDMLREKALLGQITVFGRLDWRSTRPADIERLPRQPIPKEFWKDHQIDVRYFLGPDRVAMTSHISLQRNAPEDYYDLWFSRQEIDVLRG